MPSSELEPDMRKVGNDFFQNAFNDYRTELGQSPKKKRFIGDIELNNGSASAEELQKAVETLVKQCENQKLRHFWRKYLIPVVNGLDELSGVIGGTITAVSNVPQAAPLAVIWGGLKFMMGWAQRFSSIFEQIQNELETLSEYIFRLAECKEIYSITPYTAPSVQRILARSYKTILVFWYRVTKELRRGSYAQLARALFPSDKLKKILDQLKEDADALDRVCDFAEKELQNESRELIKGIKTEFTEQRIEAAIERAAATEERKLDETRWKNSEERQRKAAEHLKELIEKQETTRISIENENASRMRHERENRRRQAINSIRGDSSRSRDLLREMIKERHPSSCEWLFDSPEFQRWTADQCDTPIFWLNGRHGAGKSFLCAAAIDRMRLGLNAPITAIQFLKKGTEVSKVHVLQNLVYQMTRSLEAVMNDVPDHIIALIEECKDDYGVLETLIPNLFSELDSIYIFIDGLDEASNGPDIQDLVHFLIEETVKAHSKVRVWFGSQPLPQIEEYMRKLHVTEVVEKEVHVIDTEADIKTYLAAAIPESVNGDEFARILIRSCMETEVEGSFLWASSMISDLKEKAEDAEDMMRLAFRGLPTKMDDIYREIVAEYKKRDRTKRFLHSNLPLWKIILSLLTYTKRPLRLLELREAVAILRSAANEDLSTSKFVSLTTIRKECSRLVRFIQEEDSEDGTLELNHSAVFAFLREDVETEDVKPEECVVSRDLICDCCVKYLSQPRYSRLLGKKNHYEFTTWLGESTSKHQLLLYAAKYWYRHCDEKMPSPDSQDRLRKFLLSPNFQTLIQVQSLSIIGHFLLRFDQITGQPLTMKKILPDCVRHLDSNTSRILPQFNDFIYEWSELLQLGLTAEYNGEIDRCFWRALGPPHFLQNKEGRYNSFHFMSPDTLSEIAEPTKGLCFFHAVSPGEHELVLCKVQSSRECENGKLRISVERWRIDGTKSPSLVDSRFMNVPCADVQWSLYNTPCSRKVAIIPQSTSAINPGTIALLGRASGIRIGSRIFLREEDSQGLRYTLAGSKPPEKTSGGDGEEKSTNKSISKSEGPEKFTTDISEDAASLREYCEEIAHQGNLLVICRRRIPKLEPTEKESHRNRNTSRRSPRRRRRGSETDSSGDDSGEPDLERDSEDDEIDSEARAFSDTSSLKGGSSSDSLISLSDDSKSSDEDTDKSVSGGSETNDFDVASNSAESCDGSDSSSSLGEAEETDTDETDSRSLLSAPSSEPSDDEVHDYQGAYEYPVEINGRPSARWKGCDQCRESALQTWYHCSVCFAGDYDLCHRCIKNGEWCLDKSHQLYEEVSCEGVVSVISWSGFVLGQELLIFDTNSTMEKPIFTRSVAESATLHRSAPAIHPLLPLVVWPICAEKLLFVDTTNTNANKKRCFSEQLFKATSSKARQISIDVFFSPRGEYLHVGSVEAQRRKSKSASHSRGSLREKHYDLTFHITTMRLSSTNPAKGRPTIISRQCHALGIWSHPFVSILPYSWTWTPAAVYFTMTGFKLRVYRVPLPSREDSSAERRTTAEASCCSPALITTPRETIFLPRSARERSVHFFPCPELSSGVLGEKIKGPDSGVRNKPNSTLIIGPRYGPKASPPIGVYLSERDLGPWINVHDKEGEERMRPPKRRFTGAFEEFDEDDDCDIIPFDNGC